MSLPYSIEVEFPALGFWEGLRGSANTRLSSGKGRALWRFPGLSALSRKRRDAAVFRLAISILAIAFVVFYLFDVEIPFLREPFSFSLCLERRDRFVSWIFCVFAKRHDHPVNPFHV